MSLTPPPFFLLKCLESRHIFMCVLVLSCLIPLEFGIALPMENKYRKFRNLIIFFVKGNEQIRNVLFGFCVLYFHILLVNSTTYQHKHMFMPATYSCLSNFLIRLSVRHILVNNIFWRFIRN